MASAEEALKERFQLFTPEQQKKAAGLMSSFLQQGVMPGSVPPQVVDFVSEYNKTSLLTSNMTLTVEVGDGQAPGLNTTRCNSQGIIWRPFYGVSNFVRYAFVSNGTSVQANQGKNVAPPGYTGTALPVPLPTSTLNSFTTSGLFQPGGDPTTPSAWGVYDSMISPNDLFNPGLLVAVDSEGRPSEAWLQVNTGILQGTPDIPQNYSLARTIGGYLTVQSSGQPQNQVQLAGRMSATLYNDNRQQSFSASEIIQNDNKQFAQEVFCADGVCCLVGPQSQKGLRAADFNRVSGDGTAGYEKIYEKLIPPSNTWAPGMLGFQYSANVPWGANAAGVAGTYNSTNFPYMIPDQALPSTVTFISPSFSCQGGTYAGCHQGVQAYNPSEAIDTLIWQAPAMLASIRHDLPVQNYRVGPLPIDCELRFTFEFSMGAGACTSDQLGHAVHVLASVDTTTGIVSTKTVTFKFPTIGQAKTNSSWYNSSNSCWVNRHLVSDPSLQTADGGWTVPPTDPVLGILGVDDAAADTTALNLAHGFSGNANFGIAAGDGSVFNCPCSLECQSELLVERGWTYVGTYVFHRANVYATQKVSVKLEVPRLYDPGFLGPNYVVRCENLASKQNLTICFRTWVQALASANFAQYMREYSKPSDVLWAEDFQMLAQSMFADDEIPLLKYIYNYEKEFKAAVAETQNYSVWDWMQLAFNASTRQLLQSAAQLRVKLQQDLSAEQENGEEVARKIRRIENQLGKVTNTQQAQAGFLDDLWSGVQGVAKTGLNTAVGVGTQMANQAVTQGMRALPALFAGGMMGESAGMMGESTGMLGYEGEAAGFIGHELKDGTFEYALVAGTPLGMIMDEIAGEKGRWLYPVTRRNVIEQNILALRNIRGYENYYDGVQLLRLEGAMGMLQRTPLTTKQAAALLLFVGEQAAAKALESKVPQAMIDAIVQARKNAEGRLQVKGKLATWAPWLYGVITDGERAYSVIAAVTGKNGPGAYLAKISPGRAKPPKTLPMETLLKTILDFVYKPLSDHLRRRTREPQDIMKEYKRRVRTRSGNQGGGGANPFGPDDNDPNNNGGGGGGGGDDEGFEMDVIPMTQPQQQQSGYGKVRPRLPTYESKPPYLKKPVWGPKSGN